MPSCWDVAGQGHVDLGEKGTLEPSKWQAKFEPLENHGVHEEEEVLWVCGLIDAHRFAFSAGQDLHESVVLLPENEKFLARLALLICLYVLEGGDFGGFG